MLGSDVDDFDWYLDHVVVPGGTERYRVGPVRERQGHWLALAHRLRASAGDDATGRAVQLAVRQGFVLSRAAARECGMSDAAVRGQVRRGRWTRVGLGMVAVVGAADAACDEREAARRRHVLRAAAAAVKRTGHSVAAGSAAVLHGLPVRSLPELPELCTATGRSFGRLEAARIRYAALDQRERDSWFGIPVMTCARTVVEVARFDPEGGLMAADAALHEHLLIAADLDAALDRACGLSGVRHARRVLSLAHPRIESPLESLTHLRLHEAGFPSPELQYAIVGANGKRYRADFAWPHVRLIVEADGREKYSADELWTEKDREIALHRAGWRVVRIRWKDVTALWPATRAWLRELLADRSA
jgi:hypothetical protein